MSEQKHYAIFWSEVNGVTYDTTFDFRNSNGYAPFNLHDFIKQDAELLGGRPVAWCEVEQSTIHEVDKAYAESIAAGRLIDRINGQYIPRIPSQSLEDMLSEEEDEPMRLMREAARLSYAASKPTTSYVKFTCVDCVGCDKCAPTDPNAAMIARDEKAKPGDWILPFEREELAKEIESLRKPTPNGLGLSPDLSNTSHQVLPGFGSAAMRDCA